MFDFSAGENAIFQCKLKDSSEAVKVTWLKDNKPLTDRLMDRCSISGTESDHQLQLMHCREDDTGVYTAVAENVKGNAHCTAQLVVYEREFFSIYLKTVGKSCFVWEILSMSFSAKTEIVYLFEVFCTHAKNHVPCRVQKFPKN